MLYWICAWYLSFLRFVAVNGAHSIYIIGVVRNMKPIKVTDRNVMFTEPMGEAYSLNTGLILGKQFNYIIDTGLGSGSVNPVLEYIGTDKKPIIVINTHCHWDHIWGNGMFQNNVIISHVKCRELINKYWDEALEEFGASKDGEVHKCLPNLVFDEKIIFPEDGIEVFFTPGHSEDCISIYDKTDKVLYAGDNIGDTDDIIVPYINTDLEVFRNTIKIYRNYDFEVCICGHNKPQGRNITELMDAALDTCWKNQIAECGLPG
jgi:glyoxylase-like metal-dependent hydrolase (beta-lactamase superfamily II)